MRSNLSAWINVLTKLGIARSKQRKRTRHRYGRRLRFEHVEDRCMLAAFTVNSTADPSTFSLTDAEVSLREAVFRANEFVDHDTIDFAASLNNATIMLTQGELSITELVTIDATDANGIPRGITIDASMLDPTPTVDQGDGSRIFNISNFSALTEVELNSLTLTGGDMDGVGGAILATGNLTLKNTTITGNASVGGGGIFAQFALAG